MDVNRKSIDLTEISRLILQWFGIRFFEHPQIWSQIGLPLLHNYIKNIDQIYKNQIYVLTLTKLY